MIGTLINSIPRALTETDFTVCSSVNIGSTKTGINMTAVRDMGRVSSKRLLRQSNGSR